MDVDTRCPFGRLLRPIRTPISSSFGGDPLEHTDPFVELAGLTLLLVASAFELRNGIGTHGGGGLMDSPPAFAKAAPKPSVLHSGMEYCRLCCRFRRKRVGFELPEPAPPADRFGPPGQAPALSPPTLPRSSADIQGSELSSPSLHSGLIEGEFGKVSAGPTPEGEVLRRVGHRPGLDSLSDLEKNRMLPGHRFHQCCLHSIMCITGGSWELVAVCYVVPPYRPDWQVGKLARRLDYANVTCCKINDPPTTFEILSSTTPVY